MSDTRIFEVCHYDPDSDVQPYIQAFSVELKPDDRMLLDVLIHPKTQDQTLNFRRSCREGVCGSDAMDINDKNGPTCTTNLNALPRHVVLHPSSGPPVIRDLIVDMTDFFKQYQPIRPYLANDTAPPERECLQSPRGYNQLDGLYECIPCACYSSVYPSCQWNPDEYIGPAGLLQAYRFLTDSRDKATAARLDNLDDPYRLFRCRTIINYTSVYPKGLNPAEAISEVRNMFAYRAI